MDSASWHFVLFGLAVALLSNVSRSALWRSIVLAGATAVFLAVLAPRPVVLLPLAIFLTLGYLCLCSVRLGWVRAQTVSVLVIILVYIWLKQYTFLPKSTFLHFSYLTLGLSYVFFRVLHLIIEAGEGNEEFAPKPVAYLLYALNFTTFISGPIQRYNEFARDQFAREPIGLGIRTAGLQLERIIRGFFKVNVLATLLYALHESAITELARPLSTPLKMYVCCQIAVLYPFFLYCNFSGYIDIVIGVARLMRLRLPENFNRPFSATSFIDFWNRWHITLSVWLKTYVYNPLLLALMRRWSSSAAQPMLGVFSFFVTFFLIGLWHGRTSEFLVFGVLQGGGVAGNKLWQIGLVRVIGRGSYKALSANPVYSAASRGLTFSWFTFTLFWFWSNWAQIRMILSSAGVAEWIAVWIGIWFGATIVLAGWEWLRSLLLSIRTAEGPVLESRYARVVYATAMAVVAVVTIAVLNQPAPDVVYKAF